MSDINEQTMMFNMEKEKRKQAENIIKNVFEALTEKGYNPVNQIVGYILSGDPSYITSYNNARNMVKQLERDELLEELLLFYIENISEESK